MIDEAICAILIVPLFTVIGGVGGVLMGVICRHTNWPKKTSYSIGVLPFLIGSIDERLPLPNQIRSVERSVAIAATPGQVWSNLVLTRDIHAAEVETAWMYRIGVPLPTAGVTEVIGESHVRHVTMGKGIHFDQVATVWQPNRRVIWSYRFNKESFPPQAIDDHVRIGGEYFDLIDTEYSLTTTGEQTQLRIRMSFRVSTRFNWYARPITEFLVGNFEEVILNFYANRTMKLNNTEASKTAPATTIVHPT